MTPRQLQLATLLLLLTGCPSSGSVSKHPLVIVMSFDGFRYDYLNRTETPNFDFLAANGVRAPWIESCFITKTFPNHHSIATGLYAESHGIVANSFYDPELNDTFHMSDTGPEWWDTGAVPAWINNQMSAPDRYSGGMMWPGTPARIKNQTAHFYIKYTKTPNFDGHVDVVIDWLTDPNTPANCIYMYFDQPDAAGHQFGPDSPEVTEQIREADNATGYLIQRLREVGLFDRVNLVVTSDHGMTDVPDDNIIDLTKIRAGRGPRNRKTGRRPWKRLVDTSSFRYFGSSPVWSILPNPGKEAIVFEMLQNASLKFPHFVVYKKEDIPDEYHYKNNRRILPILVVADEHYDIFPYEKEPPDNPVTTGNHGYLHSLESMRPFFIAKGPAFKTNYTSEPFRNIDIYPLVCCLLGVQPSPNNGSLEKVLHLLKNPCSCA